MNQKGLCGGNPGEFIAIVNVTKADGGQYVQFYRTRVPYLFTVSTSAAEHGSVSEGGEVSRGEEKNRFLHGRRRLPARETLGGRLVSAGDGISGQLHIFRYPKRIIPLP